MKKRTMRYLSGTFFISTVPILVGTQQVYAEGGNPATPEQQKEIVDYCYKEVQKYCETHYLPLVLKKKFYSETKAGVPNEINLAYKEYFENGSLRTTDDELKLAEKLYQDAQNCPYKMLDCKLTAVHMSNYLMSKGIQHVRIWYIVPGREKGHTAVMYAVNEPSKVDANEVEKNWYVLDMFCVLDMELTSGRYIPLKEGAAFNIMWALDDKLAIKEAKDAAQIPLVDYAAWKYGFCDSEVVTVFDPSSSSSLQPKCWEPYDSIPLGDYLMKNSPDFAKKYLVLDAAGTSKKERQLDGSGNPVPYSRRWIREVDLGFPRPTFFSTFIIEVIVKGRQKILDHQVRAFDEKLYSEWMQKNSSLNNV